MSIKSTKNNLKKFRRNKLALALLSVLPWVAAGANDVSIRNNAFTSPPDGFTVETLEAVQTILQDNQFISIEWSQFDIGKGETVKFLQPNIDSVALNKITSLNGSTIAGNLEANGTVILVNPNGIIFTPDSKIDVGGLVASGLSIETDISSINEKLNLFFNDNNAQGVIRNQGTIEAKSNGIVLVGTNVVNTGTITSHVGQINLIAGKDAVISFSQNGLISVSLKKIIEDAGEGVPSGDSIEGIVLLTEDQKQDIFSNAVNHEGLDASPSVIVHGNGSFTIGDIENNGDIIYQSASLYNAEKNIEVSSNIDGSSNLSNTAVNIVANNNISLSGSIKLNHSGNINVEAGASIKAIRNGQDLSSKSLPDVSSNPEITQIDDEKVSANPVISTSGGDLKLKAASIDITQLDLTTTGGNIRIESDENIQLGNINTSTSSNSGSGNLTIKVGSGGGSHNSSNYILTSEGNLAVGGKTLIEAINGSVNLNHSAEKTHNFLGGVAAKVAGGSFSISTQSSLNIDTNSNGGGFSGIEADSIEIKITGSESARSQLEISGDLNSLADDGEVLIKLDGYADALLARDKIYTSKIIIKGNSENNSVTALNVNNDWAISAKNSGSVSTDKNKYLEFENIDTLIGGDGNDHFTLGEGGSFSTLVGGEGTDTLTGSNVATRWTIGPDTNTLNAPESDTNKVAWTGTFSGIDALIGGTGVDTFTINTAFTGRIDGGAGDDIFDLKANVTDRVDGGEGEDIFTIDIVTNTDNVFTGSIDGGEGNDVFNIETKITGNLIGGAGDDHFTLGEGGSFSTLVGGEGTDTLTGSNVATRWTIGPDTNTLNAPESDTNKVAWTGTFSGIDALNGGDGNNTFTLNTHFAGTITGGDGNDHFTLGEGGSFSTLVGGEGTDTLTGSNVATLWTIGTAANTISATRSTDSVAWVGQFSGIDALIGGTGVDTFTINTAFTGRIDGGAGDDIFDLKANVTDRVDGGEGEDTFTINIADNAFTGSIDGGEDEDVFHIHTKVTGNLIGGAGDDQFVLKDAGSFSVIDGGEGTDTLTGSNVDTVWTIGTNANTHQLSQVNGTGTFTNINTLIGGTGVDTFTINTAFTGRIDGGAGDDIFYLKANVTDRVDGGEGEDTFTINIADNAFTGSIDGGEDEDVFHIHTKVTGNLIGGAGDDQFVLKDAGSFSVIDGGEGTDTLTGSNVDTVWTIGTNANTHQLSQVNGTGTFTNINTLIGGTGVDTFTINTAFTGRIDGGAGDDIFYLKANVTDRVDGGEGEDTFTINIADNAFTGSIDGGEDEDVFHIHTKVTGNLIGGAGDDQFVLKDAGSFSVIDGGTGSNSLTGSNVDTVWTIGTEANTISATRSTDSVAWVGQFSGIDALIGGTGVDTFTINTAFTGRIDGGAGDDTFNINAAVKGDLIGGTGSDNFIVGANGAATAIYGGTLAADGSPASLDNQEINSLQGRSENNTWIHGEEAYVGETPQDNAELTKENSYVKHFAGINKLLGGDKADIFNINTDFTGSIDGGKGADIFELNANVTDRVDGGDGEDVFNIEAKITGNLIGGAGDDQFVLKDAGSFSVIDGGTGSNSLTGSNVDTVWTIGTEANTISATRSTDSVAWVGQFSGIDALIGGTGVDTFTLNTHFAGTITGGAGNDHFTLGESGSFSTLVGGEGTDTLTGSNVATLWTIGTEANTISAKKSTDSVAWVGQFSGIDALIGGTGVDTFTINTAFTGRIDGGAGNDIFDLKANVTDRVDGGAGDDVFNIHSLVSGQLMGGTGDDQFVLKDAGSFSVIDGGTGSNSLTGSNVDTVWTIGTEANTISATRSTDSIAWVGQFSGIDALIGGTGVDTFTINTAFTGRIDGGAGDDTFNINAAVKGDLIGGTGSDNFIVGANGAATAIYGGTLAADGSPASLDNQEINSLQGRSENNTWIHGEEAYVGETPQDNAELTKENSYVKHFAGINKLLGGDKADIFNINTDFTGSIDGGKGADIFELNANVTDRVDGGDGEDVFNIEAKITGNLIGGAGDDQFVLKDVGSFSVIDGGTGSNSLTGSNVDIVWTIGPEANTISATRSTDSVAWVGQFSGIDALIGGTGVDTFTINTAFTGRIDGGAGDDIFDLKANVSGRVDGGAGDDVFNIHSLVSGQLMGGAGDDQFVLKDAGSFSVIDGGTGSNSLTGSNVDTVWTIGTNANTHQLSQVNGTGTFTNINTLIGGTGVDTFTINTAFTGRIDGGAGDDIFYLKANVTDRVDGGEGEDTFTINIADNAFTGSIDGGEDEDVFHIHTKVTGNLIGGAGDDQFVLKDAGSFSVIDGGEGTDTLTGSNVDTVWTIGTNANTHQLSQVNGTGTFTNINTLIGGTGVDTFTINTAFTGRIDGGAGDDIFYLKANVTDRVDGGEGEDTFTINIADNAFIGSIDGGEDEDVFHIHTKVTGNLIGGAGDDQFVLKDAGSFSVIDGGEGTDTLTGSNVDTVWTIGTNANTHQLSQVNGTGTFTNINTLIGGTGVDTFTINTAFTGRIDGGAGDDIFYLKANVTDRVDGGEGEDTFTINIADNAFTGSIDGGEDEDVFHIHTKVTGNLIGGAGDDQFVLKDAGSFSVIDGGEGTDTLTGSNVDTVWTIGTNANTHQLSQVNGTGTFTNINTLIGGTGVDTFTINTAFTGRIDGGAGDDIFYLKANVTDRVDGGEGEDTFTINIADNAFTGSIDGGEDEDVFHIHTKVTGNLIGGAGDDQFVLKDAGSFSVIDGGEGTDTLTGSNVDTVWTIGTNANTHQLSQVNGTGTFTNINTLIGGTGVDTFTINTAFTGRIDGGAGDDVFAIKENGSVTTIVGGEGRDTLEGKNRDTLWSITNTKSSLSEVADNVNSYVDNFTGVETLVGGASNDRFLISAVLDTDWIIDGGAGSNDLDVSNVSHSISVSLDQSKYANFRLINIGDILVNKAFGNTLIAQDQNNHWAITGENIGHVNNINFKHFSIFKGGSGIDRVEYQNDSSRIIGSFDFGGGVDTLDTSKSTQKHEFFLDDTRNNISGLTIKNLENITASGNNAHLYSADASNQWIINLRNSGTLSADGYSVNFNGIDNFVGGSGNDTFIFDTHGLVTGKVDGGGQIDRDVVDASRSSIDIHLWNGDGHGFDNIEHFIGNSKTTAFYGNNINNRWNLEGTNAGTINGISFTGMPNIVGGNQTDVFNLSGASIEGSIRGRQGSDEFYIVSSSVAKGIYGDEGNDVFNITINNENSRFSLYGGEGTNQLNIKGGNQTAVVDHRLGQFDYRFPFDTKTSIYFDNISSIDDQVLAKEINIYSHPNYHNVEFGNGSYQITDNPLITYSNKDSLSVFSKANDKVVINDNLSINKDIKFHNGAIDYLGGVINSDTLHFINTSGIGSTDNALVIDTNGLVLRNTSGAANIQSRSDLNILEMVTNDVSPITILASGDIESSTALFHQGNLFLTSTLGSITLDRNNQFGGGLYLDALFDIDLINNIDINLGYLKSQTATINSKGSVIADENNQIISTAHLTVEAEQNIHLLNEKNIFTVFSSRSKNIKVKESDGFFVQGLDASDSIEITTNGSITLNSCITCESTTIRAKYLSIDSGIGSIIQNTDIDVLNEIDMRSNGYELSGNMSGGNISINAQSGDFTMRGSASISSKNDVMLELFKLNQMSDIHAQRNITIKAADDINMNSGTITRSASGSILLDAKSIGLSLLEAKSGQINTQASKNIFNNGSAFNIVTQHWIADAVSGIGSNANADQAIFTDVNQLSLTNAGVINGGSLSSIHVNEKDSVIVNRMANNGDIALRIGVGDIVLNKRNNSYFNPSEVDARKQGAVFNTNQGELGGTLELYLTDGSILPMFEDPSLDLADSKNPDIFAENAIFYYENREFLGQRNRRMIMSVRNTYDNNARFSYIRWYNGIPPINNNDTSQKIKDFSLSEQLVLIEEVSDVNPAVFTNVRNYISEDIGILLPPDQRFDSEDEEEDESSSIQNHLSSLYP